MILVSEALISKLGRLTLILVHTSYFLSKDEIQVFLVALQRMVINCFDVNV